jgi:probable AcnD-accessory protein PrpF
VPRDGVAVVRIWQANIGKTIIAHVPMTNGEVQETGDFELDGVTFPAAEVQLEFMDPAAEEEGAGGSMFPTGNLVDDLEVPGVGTLKATMINAGIPTIFVNADAIGYTGTELQDAINGDAKALAMFETIRAHGALRMGLIKDLSEAATRQHTPKVAFVAPPNYTASSGKQVAAGDIDLLVRALSMGKLHHAMMGTAAVAIGTAAAIPGTLVNLAAGGGERGAVRFGHPSGTLRVGAEAVQQNGEWSVTKSGHEPQRARADGRLGTRTGVRAVSVFKLYHKNGGDMNYADFYQRSIVAPEQFWQDEAALIDWNTPFSQVLDYSRRRSPAGSWADGPTCVTTRWTAGAQRRATSPR